MTFKMRKSEFWFSTSQIRSFMLTKTKYFTNETVKLTSSVVLILTISTPSSLNKRPFSVESSLLELSLLTNPDFQVFPGNAKFPDKKCPVPSCTNTSPPTRNTLTNKITSKDKITRSKIDRPCQNAPWQLKYLSKC